MRVYDINYLNENEGEWVKVVSTWLKDSDTIIEQRLEPIISNKALIETQKNNHEALLRNVNKTDYEVKKSSELLEDIKLNQRILEEKLQDQLREDPNLFIHVEDSTKFSAKEAKEFKELTKRRDIATKEIEEQKLIIAQMKQEISKRKASAMKAKTVQTGKKKLRESDTGKLLIEAEEKKLHILQKELDEEIEKIQEKIIRGEVNPRFYYKEEGSQRFNLKNPDERLKFRNTHESDFHRQAAAKAYYHSILQMNPEDIISDVFGHLTGKKDENPLKRRTLAIPDDILYKNNFMTKNLYAKTANYVNYLARRTHLKTSFQNVTVNGDFEELAVSLLEEHKNNRELFKNDKKMLRKEKAAFEAIKKDMKTLYENRMLGLNKRSNFDEMARRFWMSITAAVNLHNLPAMQITDLGFGGFQHGIWPFVRDAVYPIINSMGGILKTKDSEALRKMAPHLNLGYQDMLNNYADRNWHSELQPSITMGKIVSGAEKFSHFSSLTDLTPYIDNGLQHAHGSVIQSRFMELLHKQLDGTLTDQESLYLRKYGIDPKQWAERMVNSYKEAEGFQTALGGYVSKVWQWQDIDASNLFNDAVFRGIQNTLIIKGMADSPFFADNILGLFMHTFTGWGYAAANRYLIPSLQHPDGQLLLKMLWMYGAGSLVSPLRRISRGEEPWPEDMTEKQIAYEAFSDSGVMSTLANVLNIANFLSSDKLLGDLKNDKFKNRARTGIFGMSDVVSSTASRISDVLGMANSGIDEKDMKTAARMLPISGAMYGHYFSDKLIESWNLPRNKRAAEAE
jgi:hypothetical protein